jgi:hypothetical protein
MEWGSVSIGAGGPSGIRLGAEDLLTGEMEDRIAHVFMEADHVYVQDTLDMAPVFVALK